MGEKHFHTDWFQYKAILTFFSVFLVLGLLVPAFSFFGCTPSGDHAYRSQGESQTAYSSSRPQRGVARKTDGLRVALVIGNGRYDSDPLRNPPNDARDMANVLRSMDFRVIEQIDADKKSMLNAIDAFYGQLQRADVGLFYYAGHGMQVNNRNYLIPVRAHITSQTDVELEVVDARRVLGKMEESGSGVNIVVLDACLRRGSMILRK